MWRSNYEQEDIDQSMYACGTVGRNGRFYQQLMHIFHRFPLLHHHNRSQWIT